MPSQVHSYIGVWPQAGRSNYQVQARGPDGIRYNVGSYAVAEEAAAAYDLAVLALWERGNVRTNSPPGIYSDEQVLEALKKLRPPTKTGKSSRFHGVSSNYARWRAQTTSGGVQVALGTFETEEEAALQYDLAQLYLHACDPAAAATHKLNMDCWATFNLQQLQLQLQELTAGVGCLITAFLLERNQPITPQQQQQQAEQKLQGVQPLAPIPAVCSVMAPPPVKADCTSQHLHRKQQQQSSQEGGHKPGKKVKALQQQQKLPAFAVAAAALAAAQHQLQIARDAREAAAGASKPERKAAKQMLKAAEHELKKSKETAAAAQAAIGVCLAMAGEQPGSQQKQGGKQGSRKRAREGSEQQLEEGKEIAAAAQAASGLTLT